MLTVYNPHAPKRAANLSVNGDLLSKAKDMNINLSAALEQALVRAVKEKEREQWLADNRNAIDAYNTDIETQGAFSDGLRSF